MCEGRACARTDFCSFGIEFKVWATKHRVQQTWSKQAVCCTPIFWTKPAYLCVQVILEVPTQHTTTLERALARSLIKQEKQTSCLNRSRCKYKLVGPNYNLMSLQASCSNT